MGDLSKNFSRSEFACRCGCGFGTNVGDIDLGLVRALQTLRDMLNVPLKIRSGCRCASWNRAVGGVRNSQHLYGKAADVVSDYVSWERIAQVADRIPIFREGGLGRYPTKKFVHMDTRGYRARWTQ